MQDRYFIVLDAAPIKGSPTPKYDLMFGDHVAAIGFLQASAKTIKELVAKVPKGELVFRTFLRRTDGKTGFRLIPRAR